MTNRRNELELSSTARGDSDLKSLLDCWRTADAPASLRARVVSSYRREFANTKEETMEGYGIAKNFGAGLALAGASRGEFQLTILEHEGLLHRLASEVAEIARDSRLTRAELRRDPFGFARRFVTVYAQAARRALARENVGYGVAASFAVVLTFVCALVAFDHGATRGLFVERERGDLQLVGWASDVPKEEKPDAGGAGMSKSGHGGGQKLKLENSGGGGGGGRSEDKPAVVGKLPQATLAPQLVAPDPHPPMINQPALPVAPTLQADPVLFPTDERAINYGDPKSKATELSAGTGTGKGIGAGTGGGVGEGDGAGYGRGRDFNTGGGDPHIGGGGAGTGGEGGGGYDRIFNMKDVTRRAVIVSRPEPLYTDEARKDQITGTVVLRFVLNANGTVTNIVALSRLPDGLTEKAIEAARQIKFTPAEKDGRRVSQYATINYNFNIY
jgi:TonB family protein